MKIILSFDIFFPKGDTSVQISSIENKTKQKLPLDATFPSSYNLFLPSL